MDELKFKYDIHLQRFGRTWVGIALDENRLPLHGSFQLNETGYFIAVILQSGASRDEIVRRVLDEYDTDEVSAKVFVDDLLSTFRKQKLI